MSWLLVAALVWVSVAAPLSLLLGRAVRLADHRDRALRCPTVPHFVPDGWTASTASSR